ncbi:malate synthase G, partial [Flavobacterium sp. IR1]
DALYGTDVISEENGQEKGKAYNPVRGEKVIAMAKEFLDETAPLSKGSHKDAEKYTVEGGTLVVHSNGVTSELNESSQFVGYQGAAEDPSTLLLKNNGLHFEIQIDREHPIGKTDRAGVKDVVMEAAITTIMDCEDSVAAVDAEDKVGVY